MASLAGAMQRSSATARGCKPADAGNFPNHEQRTHDVSRSALKFSPRDRAREDVSPPQVTTTVVDDVVLMQELEIAGICSSIRGDTEQNRACRPAYGSGNVTTK